jgi:hypothetical protein
MVEILCMCSANVSSIRDTTTYLVRYTLVGVAALGTEGG